MFALSLSACATSPALSPIQDAPVFATILSAPPSAPDDLRAPPLSDLSLGESSGNPDASATRAAMAIDQRIRMAREADYVGMRVIRDPTPRFAFHFRGDAAAILARYTRDPRFIALDGGVPREELQPLFDEWWTRLEPHRVLGAGSVMEFEGVARLDLTIDQAGFEALAAREGWVIPKELDLSFAPAPNPRSVDPELIADVRVFAREDRLPVVNLQAALSGRLILRDGCFRLQEEGDANEPLVLFGRDVELRRDEEGHLIVSDASGRQARVGERIVWSGPRAVHEADAGVHALRAACGSGPIIAVGEPQSAARFDAGHARKR
jgi:hypothetical protein